MRPGWSALRARVSNRLARHLRAAPFRLHNTSPMVSFTFDDIPKTAATVGASIVEEYNARGTFYVSGGLVDQWSGHWTGASADEYASNGVPNSILLTKPFAPAQLLTAVSNLLNTGPPIT